MICFHSLKISSKWLNNFAWPIDRTLTAITTPGQSGPGVTSGQKYDHGINMWNRQRESENTRNTDDSLSSGTKLFISFLSLRFFDMRRERQFLSMLTFPSDPTTCGTPPQTTGLAAASSENRLPSSCVESQLTVFFQIPKSSAHRFRAWRHSHPQSISIWGFYCDICDCHILPPRAWTPALNVYLTNPCTKPKGSQPN